jgi:hypothetical protein
MAGMADAGSIAGQRTATVTSMSAAGITTTIIKPDGKRCRVSC